MLERALDRLVLGQARQVAGRLGGGGRSEGEREGRERGERD
jgi:hypothetical protein